MFLAKKFKDEVEILFLNNFVVLFIVTNWRLVRDPCINFQIFFIQNDVTFY